MTYEIYINDELIEISNPKVIGLTIQAGSIFQIDTRSGNLTNKFKAPFSVVNNHVLGNLRNINSENNLPYQKNTAKIVQNGIEIVPDGYAVIDSSNSGYDITIYSGSASFFNLIKDKNIKDLDLSDCSHNFDITDIAGSFANTDKFIYPIVDWGKGEDFLFDGATQEATAFMPCLFVKDLMQRSATDIGYSITGDFASSADFESILITPNSWGLTSQQVDSFFAHAQNPTTTPIVTTITGGSGFIDTVIPITFNSINNPLIVGQSYTPTEEFHGSLNANGIIFANVPSIAQQYLKIVLKKDGVAIAGDTFYNMNRISLQYSLFWGTSIDVLFEVGAVYTCEYVLRSTRIGGNYDVSYFPSIAQFKIVAYKYIPYGFPIDITTLYDKKLSDLWRDIITMYCLIIQVNDNTKQIELNYLDSIITNKNIAKDWSSKVDTSKTPNVNYIIDGYAQRNLLTCTADEDVNELNIGAYINVSNENLELEKTIVTSTNAYVQEGLRNGGKITPLVPIKEGLLNSFSKKKSRYLYLSKETDYLAIQNVTTSEFEVITDNIPYCSFIGKLDWQTLVNDNYDAITAMVDSSKVVSLFFRLTEVDVVDFDFSIPVYLDIPNINGFFYVNKISNFKVGESTQCDLIRL